MGSSRATCRWQWVCVVACAIGSSALTWSCASTVAAPRVTQAAPRLSAADERVLARRIRDALTSAGVRGAAVAVVDGGEVLYQAGFGFAHESRDIDVTPSTVFHLGDVSTLLLSTLALRLADSGALSLDDPLDRLAPLPIEPVEGAQHATLAQVLSHRSGLPPGPLAGFAREQRPDGYERAWTRMNDLALERYAFAPGEVYAPTTMAMRVLAAGLVKRTKTEYDQLVRREVRDPFGMPDTTFHGVASTPRHYAEPFGGMEARFYRDVPALGGLSTVQDMARWLSVVLGDGTVAGRRVLSAAALKRFWEVQNAGVPIDDGYEVRLGFVPVSESLPDEPAVGAQSYLSPHSVLVWTLPRERLGVVAMATQRGKHDALRQMAEDCLRLVQEGRTAPAPEPVVPEPDVAPLAEREALAGVYSTPVGPVDVHVAGDALELSYEGYEFSLTHHSDGSYGVRYKVLGLVPISVDALRPFRIRFRFVDDRRYLYVYRRGVLYVTAQELRVSSPDARWLERVGEYEVASAAPEVLFSKIELTHDEVADVLTLEMTLKKNGFKLRFAIDPQDDVRGVFAGKGHLMGSGLTFEPRPGGGEMLYFSGFVARRAR